MAICNIIDDVSRTHEEYELITAHVRGKGPLPPNGCRLVLLGRERAITVWDSSEARDRCLADRLAPAYQAVGRSYSRPRWGLPRPRSIDRRQHGQ